MQNSLDGASFTAMIANLPGLVFYKNTDFIYTASSQYAARLCGFTDVDQFCGHSDFELRCEAAASALEFRAEDQRVLHQGATLSSLQIHKFADGNIHIFLLRKAPVFAADKKIIGICSIGNEVTNPAVGKAIFNLLAARQRGFKQNDLLNQTFILHSPAALDSKDRELSAREAELIFYLLRGFNNKEIANFMALSSRTIESYLESIKSKFNCFSRKELLLKCLQQGFSYVIPQTLLAACLNQSISW